MSSKTLVVIVTRNNPVLLQHAVDSYYKYDPGCAADYFIMDCESSPENYLINKKTAKKINANFMVVFNDRAEGSFELASKIYGTGCKDIHSDYTHFFFCHDDCIPHKNGWLRAFHDRMQSNYIEPEAPQEHRQLPIGRVGAMHHFWRSYDNVKGHPIQCIFLKECFEALYEEKAPQMFKYADCDRILATTDCVKHAEIMHVSYINRMPNRDKLKVIFDRYLSYYDEGTYPKEKYPPGHYWNRMTLLSEFLNSLLPLARGYRTVGLQGDGYLESIHGHDTPWGHDFVAHYGAPNALLALAKAFNTTSQDIKKRMNDPIFLMKTQQFFQRHYSS